MYEKSLEMRHVQLAMEAEEPDLADSGVAVTARERQAGEAGFSGGL